jgi:hypothetical protein
LFQKTEISFFSDATRESLSQTNKTNNTRIQPKPPEDILGDPSIINLIRQTCIISTCKEVLEIKIVVHRQDERPMIEIKFNPMMVEKWLFDKDAGPTSMSVQEFRLILMRKSQEIYTSTREKQEGTLVVPFFQVVIVHFQWNGMK